MPDVGRRLRAAMFAMLLGAAAGSPVTPLHAQPEPSFRASCANLRASLTELNPTAEDYVTIEVVGRLEEIQSDGILVYMLMCTPPDARVLCVTYSVGERKVGDQVILTGTYNYHGPDHVMLDPCLHHVEEGPG
jgi:hypothetical protein